MLWCALTSNKFIAGRNAPGQGEHSSSLETITLVSSLSPRDGILVNREAHASKVFSSICLVLDFFLRLQ